MLYIKDWFEKKMDLNGGFIESVDGIERETEKAYLLTITVGWCSSVSTTVSRWVPKSCVMTEEEFEAEQKKTVERIESVKEKHDKAYEFAKAHGLKVRINFRTATIIEKITAAGLVFEA